MTYYKLTNKEGNTKNNMHWDVGVTNEATGHGIELCTNGYLHVYDTPEQAVFMRPAHVSSYTRLWEVESRDEGITDGTKRGVKCCTVIREIALPELTVEQLVEIGIHVSLLVYKEKAYARWAKNWLSGKNKSAAAADAAARAAADAAADAAYAAADAARAAAYAAADAAYAAADAAYAAADAAYAAADAARAAADAAADAAARAAADAAAYAAGKIDLVTIINKVVQHKEAT